jgi:hypothetical protein
MHKNMDDELRSTPFQIRMRPSVKKAGELAAKDSNRSLSALIETLLIQHLKESGYLPSGGKPSAKRK